MAQLVLFIDDGGVMNDNTLRGAQWQRLIGAYFAPRLGGTPEAWAEANRLLMDELFNPENWTRRLQAAPDYARFDHHYQLDWLRGMCTLVGVAPPANADAIVQLAHDANVWITPQVRSAFPGVVEAIRTLHQRGYTLHTASGESSEDLEGYLVGMQVRACFQHLYGPDLVHTLKASPEYYRRIFADAGVDPAEALVIDDNVNPLAWAAEVGAQTMLISQAAAPEATIPCIPNLAALPQLLETR